MATRRRRRTAPTRRLAGAAHHHRLLPIELGHPLTVTAADVPTGLATENVAVIEMRGSRFRALVGNDFPIDDWRAAFGALKDRYGDCFDFVVFFTDPRLATIPYSGYHRGVYNEVSGINRSQINDRPAWDTERLQSQIWMGRFSLGTLLQEIGHRWGSYVRYRRTPNAPVQTDLMLEGGGHWARAFDDGDSPMDYDEERHNRQSATRWLREPIGGFEFAFCNLDLYLMGLMPRREVGRFTLIRNYADVGQPLPGGRQLVGGSTRTLTVADIVRAEGTRRPQAQDSQHRFRAAFVVVARDAAGLDVGFVGRVEVMRQQLERRFQLATDRRALMDTRLICGETLSRSGRVSLRLNQDRLSRTGALVHGLGPVPVKIELALESTSNGDSVEAWSRERTPDLTDGVDHLEAQVYRDPYDGRFTILAQTKGPNLDLTIRWTASTID